jgi:hypothetical protein
MMLEKRFAFHFLLLTTPYCRMLTIIYRLVMLPKHLLRSAFLARVPSEASS